MQEIWYLWNVDVSLLLLNGSGVLYDCYMVLKFIFKFVFGYNQHRLCRSGKFNQGLRPKLIF